MSLGYELVFRSFVGVVGFRGLVGKDECVEFINMKLFVWLAFVLLGEFIVF